jgi:hypothetical protein
MEWLIEGYSKESGIPFNLPENRKKIVLSARQHLLKQAEQRKSWAKQTNELIEKFEIPGMQIRVSRVIGKDTLERWLEINKLPEKGLIEIAGKKIEISYGCLYGFE